MTHITYQEAKKIDREDLLDLYDDAGWTAYTSAPKLLVQAIQNSFFVLLAKDGDKLVGLIRVVGDGATIAYIQDILVHSAYKRKKIGSTLVAKTLEKFKEIRQIVLLTDDTQETRGFYEAMGFESCDKGQLVSFVKLRNKE